MPSMLRKLFIPAIVVVLVGGLAVGLVVRLLEDDGRVVGTDETLRSIPVEVALVERGLIQDRRTFSGTLVPRARFLVAPKIGGRIESLHVDVGDPIATGDVVAHLDDEEFVQSVAQAEAQLEVAKADLVEARSLLEIALREYERVQTLLERNIASESAVDAVQADLRAKEAQVQVAQAHVQRAQAAVASERVRLSYTVVTAAWTDGTDQRVVAERYVDEGATVAANDPIVSVVDLSPIRALMFVTERDYARLQLGQAAIVETDAFPGEAFDGRVFRLSPVFEEISRQARVEVEIPNESRRLKAGMYVRVSVVLDEVSDAAMVPDGALVQRDGRSGVFLVDETESQVQWVPVETGIRSGDRVQVVAPALEGQVVTLGQQLLDDGSQVRVASRRHVPSSEVGE